MNGYSAVRVLRYMATALRGYRVIGRLSQFHLSVIWKARSECTAGGFTVFKYHYGGRLYRSLLSDTLIRNSNKGAILNFN